VWFEFKKETYPSIIKKSSVWKSVDQFFLFERTFGPGFDTENILVASRRCFPFFPVISNGISLNKFEKDSASVSENEML
jgi:hypothetical protein